MRKSNLNILLLPFGTAGDVHPVVGLGIALRQRGHRVTMLANDHFQALALSNGLSFNAVGTTQEYLDWIKEPGLWYPIRGSIILGKAMFSYMPAQYEAVTSLHEPGNTVVVSSAGAFGARCAQEKLGFPMATLALQPTLFRSYHKLPVAPGIPKIPNALPRFAKAAIFRVFDAIADRVLLKSGVNAYRARLGLPKIHRLMKEWWFSPDCILALFPDWFGRPQPDWPAQTRMTGFPLYDERSRNSELPPGVREFLDAGDPPVVFTPGSGMMHGRHFFEAATEACQILALRGLFLTRYPEQIPPRLPATIHHFPYVPFSQVLNRSAALVHHGGIGTLAQAMAAGIPHLLMPMAYDQPDNAVRLVELGIGEWLSPKKFKAPAVAAALDRILHSPAVKERCQAIAAKFVHADPLRSACDTVESLSAVRSYEPVAADAAA